MAKVLESFEFGHDRRSKYPWSEWLDGRIWQLERGSDFDVAPARLQTQIAKRARHAGVRVRTSASQDGATVVIQAYSNEQPKLRAAK